MTSAATSKPDARDPDPPPRTAAEEQRIAAALGEHFATVWRALRRFGVQESDADDAAQQVFLSFSRRIAIVELGRERPYLLGIAARVAANARRQQARAQAAPVEELERAQATTAAQDPESLLEQEQRRQRLDEALATLPDTQREVFVLYELEGFSLPEIARTLELPLGTATSRLRRARSAFEAWVNAHVPPRGEP